MTALSAKRRRRRRPQPECDLYIPGHMVHWIQAKLAHEEPREAGVLEGVRGRVVTVRFPDRVARYRNHQTASLLDVARTGTPVDVSERYGLLRVPLDDGCFGCFCIADADESWRPCSVAPPGPLTIDDLVTRMEDRGGFTVSAALLEGIGEAESGTEGPA